MSSIISEKTGDIQEAARRAGWRGGTILAHRGLRIMPHEHWQLRISLLLGPVAALAVLAAMPRVILPFWNAVERLLCGALTPAVAVVTKPYTLPWHMVLAIAVPRLAAAGPGPAAWPVVMILAALALLTGYLLRRRYLPLALALFTLAIVVLIGALAFTPVLAPFPYVLTRYTQSMLLMGLVLMFVTPLMLMVIYYPLDFSFPKKLVLTALCVVWLAVALPCQYCLQAVVVHDLGLMALPTLFLLTGLLLDIMGLVALYSWGMSWRLRDE